MSTNPLSHLINLPRRHSIPDIIAHLSPMFTSGMLSAAGMGCSPPLPSPHLPLPLKAAGAAWTGDTVSWVGGRQFEGGEVPGGARGVRAESFEPPSGNTGLITSPREEEKDVRTS